ncbi:class I SAM-dependent methyltransferase [Peribacillus muralis]|uniref:class I SAM-dependent methyltransferase n=1 Tax=Peribacillus muralis TaxID=264697 RepID=UPI00070CC9D1|nr:methyltransferase domain-containing protein [Peribacillus muralis]
MKNVSSERFDKIATQYSTSEVHKMSETIKLAHEKSENWEIDNICDIACGAGHFGLSFSHISTNITAVDPSKNMLDISKSSAVSKGITNYKTVHGFAEQLPIPDGTFDLVISRLAPHHFNDIQKAIREMYRITSPGGHVIIIDLAGYENHEIDTFNHKLELLHDPTHIKSYSAEDWTRIFEQGEFKNVEIIENQSESQTGVPVKRWCQIASSGIEAEHAIRDALNDAPLNYLEEMSIKKIENEFYFPIKTNLILAEKVKNHADH